MLGWIILGAAVLILALLCLIPVGVYACYDGQFTLQLTIAFWRITLFPEEEEEKGSEAEKPEEKEKKPGKRRLKWPNRQQIAYSFRTLPPLLKKALGRTGRRIRISPLRLRVVFGGEDPADVAEWYGKALILRESLYPALEQLAQVRNQEIWLDTDYDSGRTVFSGQIGVRIRVGSLLWIGLTLLGGLLAWYKGYRQLASEERKTGEKPKNRQADAA